MEIVVVTDSKLAASWVRRCEEKHPVLREVSTLVWRGAELSVLVEGETPLSYNVTYYGKRKKNIWEPYANWYTAYTVLANRRQGLAKRLAEASRKEAVRRGCRRIKSLAGTMLGVRLHESFGDLFWGIKDTLEVVVDSPLVPMKEYALKRPPTSLAEIMTAEEVIRQLADRKLRYDQ